MTQPENYTFANLETHVGHDFGVSDGFVIDQARITAFAEITEDKQWIHLDVERAKQQTPFGGTIAHGYLTLSLVSAALSRARIAPHDTRMVFNYGTDKLRFLTPVPTGATLRARFTLKSVTQKSPERKLMRMSGAMHIDGTEKPAMIGEFLVLIVGPAAP